MRIWRPLGRVFPPSSAAALEWMRGYAAAPFAVDIGQRQARVFFSGRDAMDRGHIGAATIDLERLTVVDGSVTTEPLVAPGDAGTFDESGCTMSSIARDGSRWLLYYTGWTLGRTVPFYLNAGLAISDDGGRTFRKYSAAPLLDRSETDPYLNASPCVMHDRGLWRMWYVSGTSWQTGDGAARPCYLVKYAESSDAIHWRRDGHVAIPFAHPSEYAIGRPHVVRDGDLYRMWFSSRGAEYRLGHAVSSDGLTWQRVEETPPAPSEWDSQMQAYPMVLRDADRWLMFYNGNGYGATGFGCAAAERAD